MNININTHSSIQIDDLAFDPYGITDTNFKAKYIFITHTHFDHLDIESIKNIIQKDSTIIAPTDAKKVLEENFDNKIFYVLPKDEVNLHEIKVEVFASYNIDKHFHPKENNWVGYKVTKDEKVFAVLGDTDATPELEELSSIDVLFVPIGGTYTMNAIEAAHLANKIKPELVVPVHYGSIVGTKEDEQTFISNLNPEINYKIML